MTAQRVLPLPHHQLIHRASPFSCSTLCKLGRILLTLHKRNRSFHAMASHDFDVTSSTAALSRAGIADLKVVHLIFRQPIHHPLSCHAPSQLIAGHLSQR
jgi:hypothetical protein